MLLYCGQRKKFHKLNPSTSPFISQECWRWTSHNILHQWHAFWAKLHRTGGNKTVNRKGEAMSTVIPASYGTPFAALVCDTTIILLILSLSSACGCYLRGEVTLGGARHSEIRQKNDRHQFRKHLYVCSLQLSWTRVLYCLYFGTNVQ